MFQPMSQGRARARKIVTGAGYAVGGTLGAKDDDREADIKMIKRAVAEHDSQLHPGHHTRLKLKDGGYADGGMAPNRMDQRGRSGGGKQHPKSQVNIVVAPGRTGDQPPGAGGPPMPPPMPPRPPMMPPPGPPMGAGPPPPMPPPRPPMAGPPPGGMMGGPGMAPPGAPGPGAMPPRPMGIRTGGNVGRGGEGSPAMTAGAGSGSGRLEKRDRE